MPNESREESIFQEALARKDSLERAAYLNAACGDNQKLREWIELLLEGNKKTGDFLSAIPKQAETLPDPLNEVSGNAIGPYKLLQQIGEGGFGRVFMAEQQKPIIRKVALKIIKMGMDTKQVVARFESERQALALMDHPNIAKVLDAGATENGRPYFVMELVSGIPITDFCDEYRYRTDQRLHLFRDVCSAIQHAHQKGIIHRDIKPSNILVTLHGDKAVPKVIDFGIAKATQQRLTDKTLFTQFQQFIGTPAYMSPEQASLSGLDIDTRSDVYSLGVLLYELLVGRTPFDARTLLDKGFEEIRRIIREEEAPRPSQRLSTFQRSERTETAKRRQAPPEQLQSLLSGDLDWITMKALEKDRTRRYETAERLADDIRRYLDDEEVTAAAPSRSYRLRKFARRHRSAIATTAAFACLLLIATIVSIWLATQAIHNGKLLATQLEKTQEAQETAEANENRALASEHQAKNNLESLWLLRGHELLQQDRPQDALAWFAWAARANPTNQLVADNLLTTLHYAPLPRPLTPSLPQGGNRPWLDFSPEGQFFVSGGIDKTAHIWDIERGEQVGATLEHSDEVNWVTYHPDGSRILTSAVDGTVRLWSARTGRAMGTALQHGSRVNHVCFSPDGHQFVSASDDNTALIWNTETQLPHGAPLKHSQKVNWADWSSDGAWIATASDDLTAIIWNADTQEAVHTLKHPIRIRQLQFSQDSKHLLTQTSYQIRVWDTITGEALTAPLDHKSSTQAILNPAGTQVASQSWGLEEVVLWDIASGKRIGKPIRHPWTKIVWIEYSPDGQRLATAGYDSTARIWDVQSGEQIGATIRHVGSIYQARFSPDGKRLITGAYDRHVRAWDLRPRVAMRNEFWHPSQINTVQFLPAQEHFITALRDGRAHTWSLHGASHHNTINEPQGQWGLNSIAVSSDGQRAVAATTQETTHIWSLKPTPARGPALDHDSRVYLIAFSPNDEWIVTGTRNGTISLWEADSGELHHQYTAEPASHVSYDFNKSGTQLIVGELYRAILLDARTLQPLAPEMPHKDWLRDAQFTPDERQIITSSVDGILRFWDAQTCQPTGVTIDNGLDIRKIQFSQDGRYLATSSYDNKARIWDWRQQKLITPPLRHEGSVFDVILTPDSQRLLTRYGKSKHWLQWWDTRSGMPIGPRFGGAFPMADSEISHDGNWVLVTAGDNVHLYERPQALLPVPSPFIDLVEEIAGRRFSEDGRTLRELPYQNMTALRQRLQELPLGNSYRSFLEWYLKDPEKRTLTPNSSTTWSEALQLRTDLNLRNSLRDALRMSPTNGIAHAKLARLELRNDDDDDAARRRAQFHSRQAETWAAQHPETLLTQASLDLARGDIARAEARIEACLKQASLAEAWELKAKILENRKAYLEALKALDQAIELEPENLDEIKTRSAHLSQQSNQ